MAVAEWEFEHESGTFRNTTIPPPPPDDRPWPGDRVNGSSNGYAPRSSMGPFVPASTAPTLSFAENIWRPLEPPDYLVDGLLVKGSLSLIVAYGSSLKTWLLLDLALSVATGQPWLQRFALRQGKAALIDYESGEYELRRRCHRWAEGRSVPLPIPDFSIASMPVHSLADEDFYAAIRPILASHVFVGVDSLSAGSGGVDENDVRFARSLNRLKALSAETACHTTLLHHSRKKPGDGKGDPREMVRGSSAIFNACDVVLSLDQREDGSFRVTQTKARGGKCADPFVVRVTDLTAVGTTVTAVDCSDVPDAEDIHSAVERAKRAILLLLAKAFDLTSKNAVCRLVPGHKSVKLAAIDHLVEKGLVCTHLGAYRLTSDVT